MGSATLAETGAGRRTLLMAAAIALACTGSLRAASNVTITPIAADAWYASDINSCAIDVNNLITCGGYQFAAYYDVNHEIMIGRRPTGASTWQTYDSGISIGSSISDDHNVVAIAVDSTGTMHMSWDMHNVPLNYATSNASVLTANLNSIHFTPATGSNAPSLFPNAGSTTSEVTYPTFYHIPGSDNLLFSYRNGGAGGGSGNGNQYMDIYNPATKTWSQTFVINGEQTNVNGYLNSLAYDAKGNLLMSWTWRATPAFQTNSNIMFAQSPDNGVTWYKQGGTTPYALPIIQNTSNGGSPASVGQVIKSIPQNSSLINQTSMTVDNANHPLIATWWNPDATTGDPSVTYNANDPNRQYMLEYYTGTQWVTSQISRRTSDTAVDTTGGDVRDLGRPIVLVDKQNRILVVTRSEDTSMGSYPNSSTPGNDIVVYYTTDSMTAGTLPSTLHWQSVTLDGADMGGWEPTYDSALWASTNTLDLFYEPVGLSGQTSGTGSVLEWNEQAFFGQVAAAPEPASLLLLVAGGAWVGMRSRPCRRR